MKRPDARTLTILRLPVATSLAILAAVPFLFTTIPPLTDVPGHMGQFAVQTATAGDDVLRYFTFHWALTLNLASDLIVQAVHPWLGIVPAVWLLCAATPALTVIGIVAIARATNRAGAYALPWALLFVFNLPFLWGFLNFALAQAFALIVFAAWLALERRPRRRAILALVAVPLLLIGHGVAGVAAIAMIVGHALGSRSPYRPHRPHRWNAAAAGSVARALWPPILAGIVTLAVWKAFGASDRGATLWLLPRKITGIIHMLRDQNKIFDIGSVACSLVVWMLGRRWGARLGGGGAGAVILVAALFLATPSLISGSDEIDTRLAPLIPMLAFAMQDWSRVDPRRRRWVTLAGFALLAIRLGVTTLSFAGYDDRYRRELTALDHVRPGTRIINLAEVGCDSWRSERLEHLGNLATLFRGAWINSHWSVPGLHLLQISYRPAPAYFNDPSQMVFPARCVDPAFKRYANYRPAQTVLMAMRSVPLDKADYLWLTGVRLPAGYRDRRLRRIWHDDISELYAIVPG